MVLKVDHLSKSYDLGGAHTQVLKDVSFSLGASETLALEGESGSGKSTVLHLIAGLDKADSGSIQVEGSEVVGMTDAQSAQMRRSLVGVIFQQFNLIPSLSVADNISFHARLANQFDPVWSAELAERIGLADHLPKHPEALSGGQQQRVAIARTLAARPKLILADEPTGNLDETTADTVLGLLLEAAEAAGTAVLMVTHSPRLATRMQHRLVLSHGVVHANDLAQT